MVVIIAEAALGLTNIIAEGRERDQLALSQHGRGGGSGAEETSSIQGRWAGAVT
jgi:hypothetical protein